MTPDRPLQLLGQRRFGPFFRSQFSGAFNDNLINLAAGLFVLPFFLFSATAGQIAGNGLVEMGTFVEILLGTIAGGLWKSLISRPEGRASLKLPRGFRRRIDVVIGNRVEPGTISASNPQQRVLALRGEAPA